MKAIEKKSNRRDFLKCMGVCGVAALSANTMAQATENISKTKTPNVLFMLVDDQRPDTIAALGNPIIKTPNLDKLVNNGVAFKNAYCMGSGSNAVCMPSRTMILSANHVISKKKGLSSNAIPTDYPLFPRWMKKEGYATMHSGKWDNGPSAWYTEFDVNHCISRSGTSSEKNANNVIDFLKKKKEKQDNRPFFAYVGFAKPHFPFNSPKKFQEMYKAEDIPLPKSFVPIPLWSNGYTRFRYLDEKQLPFPRPEKALKEKLAGYYADISYLDEQIGRIIKTLEEQGELENTIIVYAGDHGWSFGGHGLMGKQNVYDDSMGTPLIFSGPGIPKGKTSEALVYLHDIFPTVCDLAKIEKPKKIDTKSLANVITGKSKIVRDSLFLWFQKLERSVRDEQYKLIRYPLTNLSQLYDLKNDRYETTNLADDPKYADKVIEMMELLKKWQNKVGDTLELTSENPKTHLFDKDTQLKEYEEYLKSQGKYKKYLKDKNKSKNKGK